MPNAMSRAPVWTPATRLDSSGTIWNTRFWKFALRDGSQKSSKRSYLTSAFSDCETNFHAPAAIGVLRNSASPTSL